MLFAGGLEIVEFLLCKPVDQDRLFLFCLLFVGSFFFFGIFHFLLCQSTKKEQS